MSKHYEKLEALLRKSGLPPHHGWVSGGSGVLTFHCENTAQRAAALLVHAFKVRGPIQSIEYNKTNRGTCLLPTRYTVWRVSISPKAMVGRVADTLPQLCLASKEG